jgi:hypothetical protein
MEIWNMEILYGNIAIVAMWQYVAICGEIWRNIAICHNMEIVYQF